MINYNKKLLKAKRKRDSKVKKNIISKYETGGKVTAKPISLLKRFKGNSHAKGGINIDANGNPTKDKVVANVEGGENMLKKNGKNYVFSKKLKTAEIADKIDKNFDDSPLGKKAKRLFFNRLIKLNEIRKSEIEAKENPIPELQLGGDPIKDLVPKTIMQAFGNQRGVVVPPKLGQPFLPIPNITDVNSKLNTPIKSRENTFFNRLKNITGKARENPGAIVQAGAGIASAINNLKSPEKEKLRFTNFNSGDVEVKDLSIDNQAIKNANTLAFNKANFLAKDQSRTPGQYFNRLRANTARAGQVAGELELAGQQAKNQLGLQLANREDRKAESLANEQKRVDIANAQNRAASQDTAQGFLNTLFDIGSGLQRRDYLESHIANQNDAQKKQFLLNLAVANSTNPNFGINSDILTDFINNPDKYDTETIINEIIKFKK